MTDATQHAGSTDSARSATIPVVALVGNPNTGKTSIFNLLTGGRQKVANYPGVTVERVTGRLAGAATRIDVLDLPGAYSLAARSPDEQIVCDALVGSDGDAGVSAVVVVADASNLERTLYLATQVLELGRPGVTLGGDASDALVRHGWPGNIRELRNVLERAVLLSKSQTLRATDLVFDPPGALARREAGLATDLTLREAERQHIERVLAECDGQVEKAARRLGIARSSLYDKLRRFGM